MLTRKREDSKKNRAWKPNLKIKIKISWEMFRERNIISSTDMKTQMKENLITIIYYQLSTAW